MTRIRELRREDLAAVTRLYTKVFLGSEITASEALREWFREVFLDHPWPALPVRSLVCEGTDGRILGMLGAVPRPMRYQGRPIVAAISTHFMVDPDAGLPTLALRLTKALFDGPQELSIADECVDRSRALWNAIGGTSSLIHSLRWTRLLRPLRYFLGRGGGARPGLPRRAFTALAAAPGDALLRRLPGPFRLRPSSLESQDLGTREALEFMVESAGACPLRFDYDEATLARQLSLTDRKRGQGREIRRLLLRDGRRVGCYLLFARKGATAQVAFFHALKESAHDVLEHMFGEAGREGAAAVSGRVDPRYLAALSDTQCLLNRAYGWVQIHSRDASLLATIQRGDAILTRFDGEWWLGVQGEAFASTPGNALPVAPGVQAS
ncbi:MAG: hypothetical protein ACT4PV_07485 [Planctomycetaceae bacterium]